MILFAVVTIMSAGGIYFLISGRAATQSISLEPESGTISSGAVTISDTNASQDEAIKFQQKVVTEPDPTPGPGVKLRWKPPVLTNPTTITIGADGTGKSRLAALEAGKDYIIKLPTNAPVRTNSGLRITGGRNIVMIGGEIRFDKIYGGSYENQRALWVDKWSGTLHIEGIYMSGADLKEGVNIDSRIPGSVLQAQNLLFDNVTNYSGHHADCMQNWGGPGQYRIDGLTCSTSYQGFMIQPHEGGKTTYGMDTEVADWRRINVRGAGTYKFFMGGASIPSTKKVILNDVWHSNRANGAPCNCYPHTYAPWQAIKVGTPPGGDFVTKLTAGYAYRSPGYQ